MAGLGLTWVRIGEFAWSRMEPEPGGWTWTGSTGRSRCWARRG